MLTDLTNVFRDAPGARMAFNITSVEGFNVLVDFGESYQVPLILQISERYLKDLGPAFIKDLVIPRLDQSSNPFVLHLDHAGSLEAIVLGIRLGFTSVMYDGSTSELEHNIQKTQDVLRLARPAGISVEAEIGHVGGAEDGDEYVEALFTSVEVAEIFVEKAPVDALAVAVGNAHGLYTKEPKIQVDRIVALYRAIHTPLVLHGGTGIPVEDLLQAARAGVKKINIGTELKQAWIAGAIDGTQRFKELDQIRATIKEHIHNAISGFREIMEV